MRIERAIGWAVLVTALLAAPARAFADEAPLPGAEACAMCHAARGPAEADAPAPYREAALRRSPHAGLECASCHADLAEAEFPHAAPAPVECGTCHVAEQEEFVESLHGRAASRGDKLAPTCKTCHGTHDVLRTSDARASTHIVNIPTLCNSCHREGSPVQSFYHIPKDSILQNYTESIHGEGLYRKGLLTTAVCTSCHTAHHVLPHTDPRSSIAHQNVGKTCEQCHVRIEEVHRQVVRGTLWKSRPDAVPVCVECHEPHRARKVYYSLGMSDRDCMSCHQRHDLVAANGDSMFVAAAQLAGSRHAKTACVQCHTGGNPSARRPCETIENKVDCSICHAAVVETYQGSTHGQLAAEGSPDAPRCADCHGTHGTLGRTQTHAPTYSRNVPDLCGRCHRAGEKAAVRYKGENKAIVEGYLESIHGRGLLESGLTVTATCADCHTAHGERPHTDPASTVHHDNVAATCGQCHRGIYELFEASIHSPAVSKSSEPLPSCKDCHTAHGIARTDVEDFRVSIMSQCGRCHEALTETYFETYHGKVSKLGYAKTAKCYDCHGAHDILPVWNAQSHLSRENIVATCGRCHPGSNRRFAGYLTHATHHDPHKYPALFWTFWGMTGLLVGTFAIAGLHTLAWLPRSLRYRRQLKRAQEAHRGEFHYRRFPKLYRNLHIMVIVSFIGLAVTGMMLKFSYTGWAWMLSRVLGGFEAAGFIHRVCAILTFAYFAIHLWDMIRRKRESGLSWWRYISGPNGMMFGINDVREFWQSLKWFVGRGHRPEYGRWTYWEKFDYFAVFWGVTIIGVTGLMLWFPTLFTTLMPGWMLNVATIIHSDEALLAVGFIFTVHFFNTHFRPEKFPIDTVIFTGTLPLEEFKQDRPREYEEARQSGELDARLEAPPSPRKLLWWSVFGFSALGIGISLILLILYAAIFGYR